MSVSIKNIQIQKAGPLESKSFELGRLNLFFGQNETGKTFLVEFILRSLFRHGSNWPLRISSPEGSISVEGLAPELITFTPDSSKKIEDHWKEDEAGLPLNMARLLVVKGGELNLRENVPGGIDREVLKITLTNQDIFDQIHARIPATVRNASLINQQIIGKNQGQIKDLAQHTTELERTTTLIDSVEKRYSRGPAKEIELKIEQVEDALQQQIKAKQHLAFKLKEKRQSIKEELNKFSDHTLLNLRDSIRDYSYQKKELETLSEQINDLEGEIEDYNWVKAAQDIWDTSQLDTKGQPSSVLGFAGLALIGLGIGTLILSNIRPDFSIFWPGIASALGGSLILAYYLRLLIRWSRSRSDSTQRIGIQEEFQTRFGFSPKNLVDIKTKTDHLHEKYLIGENIKKQVEIKVLELSRLEHEVEAMFLEIPGNDNGKKDWEEAYQDLSAYATELKSEIHRLEIEITHLNVLEIDYQEQPARQIYQPKLVEDLDQKLVDLKSDLAEYYKDLENLKIQVCERLGLEINTPWPDLYHQILELRKLMSDSHNKMTADLVAKIGLTEILDRIQSEEDQKIIQHINSPGVTDLMYQITGKYRKLDLEENQLFVEDQYQRYALADLSTGAIDQIHLSLRAGLASLLSEHKPLFLILDDAFQHSDWERRESLVSNMIGLVQNGWQVTYLTMDDHLRDLFIKMGKSKLKKDIKIFALE
jgi:hypothetical protein